MAPEMTISKELFDTVVAPTGVEIDEETFEKFDLYARTLIEYNEKVNLTAITAPDDIVRKHFADSLYVLSAAPLPRGAALCDVGTGAGFPGVCLKLARPDLQVTLFESITKKTAFLSYLCSVLGIEAQVVNLRAEDAGRQGRFREAFDAATARAVAQLNKLCEYCFPLVKQYGTFVPMKGDLSEEEKQRGVSAAAVLGGKLERVLPYSLPDGDRRTICVFQKKSKTPLQYPRPSAAIAKKPL